MIELGLEQHRNEDKKFMVIKGTLKELDDFLVEVEEQMYFGGDKFEDSKYVVVKIELGKKIS